MHRVEVTGDIRTLRFPEICAHCGAPPAGALPLSKMFRRTHTASNRPTEYLFGFASVPFCGACIAAHEAARRPPDPAVLRQLRNRWLLASLPYLIPIVVLVWLAGRIAPRAVDAVVSGSRPDIFVWGGIILVIALGVRGFVRRVLAGRGMLIADHDGDPNDQYVEVARGPLGINCILPGPPTPTLASVDFADEQFEIVAPNRRAFTFSNPDVAAGFAAVNADRIWDPTSPRAVRTRRANYVILALVMTLGLLVLAWDIIAN
jgi:hypothetical protein